MVWEGLKPLVFRCLQREQKRGTDLKWDNELNVALNMIKVNTKDTKKKTQTHLVKYYVCFLVFLLITLNNFNTVRQRVTLRIVGFLVQIPPRDQIK